jgi:hypothetical protein
VADPARLRASPVRGLSPYSSRVADEQEQELGVAVEELRAQLAWVRDYL